MRDKHITINLDDNEYKMIENLAIKDKRKIADFAYLKLLDGLYHYDNSVYKLDDILNILKTTDFENLKSYIYHCGSKVYNKKTLILFIYSLMDSIIEINNSYVLNNIKDAFINTLVDSIKLNMQEDQYDDN